MARLVLVLVGMHAAHLSLNRFQLTINVFLFFFVFSRLGIRGVVHLVESNYLDTIIWKELIGNTDLNLKCSNKCSLIVFACVCACVCLCE